MSLIGKSVHWCWLGRTEPAWRIKQHLPSKTMLSESWTITNQDNWHCTSNDLLCLPFDYKISMLQCQKQVLYHCGKVSISTQHTNKQSELIALNRSGTQQQTCIADGHSTWHASKYKVHKIHQKYILKKRMPPVAYIPSISGTLGDTHVYRHM